MWLTSSSIGRKVVMSVTGVALVLFLLFHGTMNLVAVFSEEGFNTIAGFLGTNAVVQFMVPILALLIVLHFIFAIILTLQNKKARGTDRYAVVGKSPVEWQAKNMFVLGLIVALGLALHLINFWTKMQLQEWIGNEPDAGFILIKELFAQPLFVVIYLIWFAAIWFHLTHGIWSSMQTLGWNNKVWFHRWHVIGNVVATIVVLIFAFVAVAFYLHSIGMWDSVGHIWTLGQHATTEIIPVQL